jgi:murein endopeptidase
MNSPRSRPRRPRARLLLGFWGSFGLLAGCAEETPREAPSLNAARDVAEAPENKSDHKPRRTEIATYTIARGGTLLNVANLYKLQHAEALRLNPGLDPERQLPPKTPVIVYRDAQADSESIGFPHDGRIVGAMPMLEGPGRKITAERWKTWATRDTILSLDRVLRKWAKLHSDAPPVLIGNLSARHGGPLSPHKTHQSGRDVDLSYIQNGDGEREPHWQHMTPRNLDAQRTWQLLELLHSQADIRVIFMDRGLQRALYRHAKQHSTVPADSLKSWLEVAPGGGKEVSLIHHVPGHADHMHVRFACADRQAQCRD